MTTEQKARLVFAAAIDEVLSSLDVMFSASYPPTWHADVELIVGRQMRATTRQQLSLCTRAEHHAGFGLPIQRCACESC